MKKILIIGMMLMGFANAQSISVDGTPSGVNFTINSSGRTTSYTSNSQLFATIDAEGYLRFYNKLGSQILAAYLYTDVEINGDTFLVANDLLMALNEITSFNAFSLCNSGVLSPNTVGSASYVDTTYTSSNTFSVLSTDTLTLPNNSQTIVNSFANGLEMYDPADSLITPTLGGGYIVRVDLEVLPSDTNATFFLSVDIGTTSLANTSVRCSRGVNPNVYSIPLVVHSDINFVVNGGKIKISASHNIEVYNISYTILKVI